MKTYLISATGVIFFSIIVSILIPEGKLKKTITFILRLACILVMIQPVAKLFNTESSNEDVDFIDYQFVCNVYSNEASERVTKLIDEKFNIECESVVVVNYLDDEFTIESVSINIEKEDENKTYDILEYLEGEGYINITVYAKSI
jgi:hypothetical protein